MIKSESVFIKCFTPTIMVEHKYTSLEFSTGSGVTAIVDQKSIVLVYKTIRECTVGM